MHRNLISFTAILLLLAACRQWENTAQLRAINQSLQGVNTIINDDNDFIYSKIEERIANQPSNYRQAMWEPRAMTISNRVDRINTLIESLKIELLKQSDSLRKANAPIVEQLYETNGDGYILLSKLVAFKESIPGIVNVKDFSASSQEVDNINRDLKLILGTAPLLPGYKDSLSESQRDIYKKKWIEENFAGSTSLLAMTQLNKIKNDVLITEKALIDYFISKTYVLNCGHYSELHPIVTIDNSYVKPGQAIEVTAGVAKYIWASRPRITINGKEIKLKNGDVAEYRFITTGKPGEHKVPVTIEFEKPDGTKGMLAKAFTYTIAE